MATTYAAVGSLVVAIFALLLSFITTMRNNTKDDSMQIATVIAKLETISDDIRDVKKDVAGLRQSVQENHDRVLILERDMSTMWKRIDEIRAILGDKVAVA